MRRTASSFSARGGLGEAEAQAKLKADGYNELARPSRRSAPRIVLDVVREPMLALLLVSGLIYLLLGNVNEALVLLAFSLFSVFITVVQETRTERVLEALRDLTSPRALVIRDGERKRIAGREVVRGDLIILSEGDRVPADAVLIESEDLQTDESLLTGESVPVRKIAQGEVEPSQSRKPGGESTFHVFSGSMVVRGAGIGEVLATGARSEIGKIGQTLSRLQREPPRLQAQIRVIVRVFAMVGGAVSVLAVLLYGILRGGWLDALLAGIALGMSMLPEEFPVIFTVFLAMGAWRISRARVLTRRAAAIETLGSATVLCTDKTGTLTENRMSIAELRLRSGEVFRPTKARGEGLPDAFHDLAEFGVLASARDPFDPMEKAFHELGRARLTGTEHLHGPEWELVHAYGLAPSLLAISHVWRATGRDEFVIATKGAPEAIAELSHLDAAGIAAVTQAVETMAAGGLRVLGVARSAFSGDQWPPTQHDFAFEFLGLVGLADPLRQSVPQAVKECRTAGIVVVMITGDYPATARAIARQAGIDAENLTTGDELEQLGDTDLKLRAQDTTVFARVRPEQKLRIVNALKANEQIVAMTGDGVNDAPSLKAAHIGIAMGGRGTDVAREAASIVLLDDDFGSIVRSIRLGRRIYDNLRKAMGFIFAVHVPVAGLALLPLILDLPILLGPMHIALLEMVIDPVCSLAFEAETEEEDIMRRPPRAPSEPLFSRWLIGWSLLQGAFALTLVAVIFLGAIGRDMPEAEVRALTFFSLVIAIIGLILVNRSFSSSLLTALRRPNRTLILVLITVLTVLSVTLFWPAARDLFRFGPLHPDDLGVTLAAGVLVLVVLDGLKFLYAKTAR